MKLRDNESDILRSFMSHGIHDYVLRTSVGDREMQAKLTDWITLFETTALGKRVAVRMRHAHNPKFTVETDEWVATMNQIELEMDEMGNTIPNKLTIVGVHKPVKRRALANDLIALKMLIP